MGSCVRHRSRNSASVTCPRNNHNHHHTPPHHHKTRNTNNNHTTTQPHNHTTTQPHNHTHTIHHTPHTTRTTTRTLVKTHARICCMSASDYILCQCFLLSFTHGCSLCELWPLGEHRCRSPCIASLERYRRRARANRTNNGRGESRPYSRQRVITFSTKFVSTSKSHATSGWLPQPVISCPSGVGARIRRLFQWPSKTSMHEVVAWVWSCPSWESNRGRANLKTSFSLLHVLVALHTGGAASSVSTPQTSACLVARVLNVGWFHLIQDLDTSLICVVHVRVRVLLKVELCVVSSPIYWHGIC